MFSLGQNCKASKTRLLGATHPPPLPKKRGNSTFPKQVSILSSIDLKAKELISCTTCWHPVLMFFPWNAVLLFLSHSLAKVFAMPAHGPIYLLSWNWINQEPAIPGIVQGCQKQSNKHQQTAYKYIHTYTYCFMRLESFRRTFTCSVNACHICRYAIGSSTVRSGVFQNLTVHRFVQPIYRHVSTKNLISLSLPILVFSKRLQKHLKTKNSLEGHSKNRHWNVVGGFNPVEKHGSNWIISPGDDEHKKYSKLPPSNPRLLPKISSIV